LIVLGHYYGEGDAQLTINGKISGQPKTYSTSFRFPQESQLYPELERLWAFATIEDMQNQLDYYGKDADIEQAITDLAVEKGLVTPYTSMIVMRAEKFSKRGIEQKNAQRVANEQGAQMNRQNTTIQDHRIDRNQPLYNTPAPSHSGGNGGAINPGLLLMLMLLLVSGATRKVKSNRG
jgi:Ca-activated chloride channel family protein